MSQVHGTSDIAAQCSLAGAAAVRGRKNAQRFICRHSYPPCTPIAKAPRRILLCRPCKYTPGILSRSPARRWFNQLCPELRRGPFDPEEDRILAEVR